MYALAQQSNFCFEKMVYKLGIVISAIAVFSGTGMRLNATESVLGYYVQDKIMLKEQSIALFLLNEKWKVYDIPSPQQGKNSNDCGYFVTYFIDVIYNKESVEIT